MRTFVIIGAGLAGTRAAETLRREGFDGRVLLIGEEPDAPYDRPPLSKGYLTGPVGTAPYLNHVEFYAADGIDLRTGTRVTGLDARSNTVSLDSGERIVFDRLLVATGASARTLAVPGADLAGVRYLRTLADARRLRHDLAAGGRMVVVGGGWIGTEIAAAARQRGLDVTLVHRGAMPLAKALGPEVAAVYRDIHLEQGVHLVSGDVAEVLGGAAVEAVRLADGRTLDANVVVAGIGARPRTELAQVAGLAVDDGVVADERLRTSAPGIFAAGDVAQAWHPRYGTSLRVEHWANALNQGVVAATNMLGRSAVYERVPYLYSDQYDLEMEYSGYAPRWDRVVFRGDPRERKFIAFWLDGPRVVAGMNVNVWDVVADIQHLVRRRRRVNPERLADVSVPLDQVEQQP
ncbi:MAG: NAD(P)/FAD-dependent oxidoreductase [Acidimicrobiales bacterium]